MSARTVFYIPFYLVTEATVRFLLLHFFPFIFYFFIEAESRTVTAKA